MYSDVDPTSVAAAPGADTGAALRALVAVCADGVALLDDDGCFAAVNDAAAQILGRPATALIGCAGPFAVTADPGYSRGVRLATSWSAPDGRRRQLEYRFASYAGGGYAVWFSDVTDTRRQQERLTAIVRVTSSVADAGSLRATLDAVAQEILQTATIAAVQILAVDHPRDELQILGMAGFGEAAGFIERLHACRRRGARIRFLETLERGEPIVVPDRKAAVMADPAWAPLHAIMGYPDWECFVAMPMRVRGHRVGVLNAYYVPGEDPGPNSLAFLGAMADHSAVAIDTASLLSRTRSQAQLDERQRLARDLHDSVVQQLFSMRMQTKALRAELDHAEVDPERMRRGVGALAEFSESALADLRGLVFELHPLELDERGLIDAVEQYAAGLEARTGLAVETHAGGDLELDCAMNVQEDLYRIIQEALHNVVKHAVASAAEIRFSRANGNGLRLEVVDNGSGAEEPAPESSPDAPVGQRRLGLVSMRERTERWGGRMVAGPLPGGGWSVCVTLPGGYAYRWKERGTDE